MADIGAVSGVRVFQQPGPDDIGEIEHLIGAARPQSGFIAKIEVDAATPERRAAGLDEAVRKVVAKIDADPQGLDWMVARSSNAVYVLGGVLDEAWNPTLTTAGDLGVPDAEGKVDRAKLVYVQHAWQKEDWEDLRQGLANGMRIAVLAYAGGTIAAGLAGKLYGAEVSARVFGAVLPGSFVAEVVDNSVTPTRDAVVAPVEQKVRTLIGNEYKIDTRPLSALEPPARRK